MIASHDESGMERRRDEDRRSGEDRRQHPVPVDMDRRNGRERRDGGDRRGLKDEMLKVFDEDILIRGPQRRDP